jgi:capsid assembly protease
VNSVTNLPVLGVGQHEAWAILPETLGTIRDVLQLQASGERFSDEDLQSRIGASRRSSRPTRSASGAVAVVPVFGVLAHRMNMLTLITGGMSTEQLATHIRELAGAAQIAEIVLDIDSPGGSVAGIPELWEAIFEARQQKRVTAVANAMAASAAYWLASAASELVATPSGQVGSIGVYALHQDLSKAEQLRGIKTTLVAAGKHKIEGNSFEPLSAEARAAMQEQVNVAFDMFVGDVSRGRGISADRVRRGYGEGRVLSAAQARAAGMIDRIATLDDVIARAERSAATDTRAVQARALADSSLELRRRQLRLLRSKSTAS